jgi:MFS family permease
MAHVAGFDRRRRARTMGSMSAGEDAGEFAGPILAGFLWSTWGVPVLLAVRIALAVVTEVYTLALTASLKRLEVGADREPEGPIFRPRTTAAPSRPLRLRGSLASSEPAGTPPSRRSIFSDR